ncbi:gamma-aminobutyric acid type B receptor subunit 2-like isoform X2 [Dysidea avara]|uniref:gamma-aminobutyric acid type B receptor subunit 2-like isoform X2 n=1 Tax=Dysidea avara TaxID=196820 RepID=UPI0033312E64
MDVRKVLALLVAVSRLCNGDDRPLYLLDLYDCIDDYEDYCHNITEFTVRAAIELANNCTDILPGYTLHTPSKSASVPVESRNAEVLVSVAALANFYDDVQYARSQNAFISPIVMGSPLSFVNEYAAYILGNKLNLSQKEDIRIIVGFFSVLDVPTIMCESYHMGLVDEHHVWILPEMNLNDIWKVAINNNYSNCSVDVLKMSLNNALMVGADYENGTDQNINVDVGELDQLLLQYYRDVNPNMSASELSNIPGYHLSRVIFDVTWAVILALNYSNSEEKLDNFLMRNETGVPTVNQTFAELLSESLNQIRFNGSSGLVDLKKGHSNNFTARISQIINDSACPVEIYTVFSNNTSCNSTSTVMFRSANACNYVWGDNPPSYKALMKYQEVSATLLYFTLVATTVFLSFALVLLVSNTILRKKKYLKTANPIINALIILAAVFIFLSSIPKLLIFGANQYNISNSLFSTLCQVDTVLVEFGIGLCYALLLVKTWRLYQIVTNKMLRRKIRCISNKAIFAMLPLLVVPVIMLLIIQFIVDRSERENKFIEYQEYYTKCSHSIIWGILHAVYQILELLCIFWQAFHVSQMKYKNLAMEGDVSLLAISVVIIFGLSVFGVEIVLRHEDNYVGVLSIQLIKSMLFATIIIICIFLPKYYTMFKNYHPLKRRSDQYGVSVRSHSLTTVNRSEKTADKT